MTDEKEGNGTNIFLVGWQYADTISICFSILVSERMFYFVYFGCPESFRILLPFDHIWVDLKITICFMDLGRLITVSIYSLLFALFMGFMCDIGL